MDSSIQEFHFNGAALRGKKKSGMQMFVKEYPLEHLKSTAIEKNEPYF